MFFKLNCTKQCFYLIQLNILRYLIMCFSVLCHKTNINVECHFCVNAKNIQIQKMINIVLQILENGATCKNQQTSLI